MNVFYIIDSRPWQRRPVSVLSTSVKFAKVNDWKYLIREQKNYLLFFWKDPVVVDDDVGGAVVAVDDDVAFSVKIVEISPK